MYGSPSPWCLHYMKLSKAERKIITDFLKKAAIKRKHDCKFRVIGFLALFRLVSREERALLKKFLRLDPRTYGFKGVRYGVATPPRDLVTIRKEQIPGFQKYFSSGTHFLPKKAYDAYRKMSYAMLRDIGCRVFVLSGYRSPAYQLVVFLETLKERKFDMKRTAKGVALPGYSEHGAPRRQAIDFTTLRLGEKGADNPAFERTKEYGWLKEHAGGFGFYLSYPRRNKWGVVFEPWHWHFENPRSNLRN